MAGGGDIQSPKKRKREAAAGKSRPAEKGREDDTTKRKRPYDAAPARSTAGADSWEVKEVKYPVTAKDKRIVAKEMSESRKMKRKPNYNLEKEFTVLWEKMRCHDVSKENKSKLVSEALGKINGKYLEIAGSPVTAQVLQTCVKWCSQSKRDAIFDVLQPHFSLFLPRNMVFSS